MSYRSAIVTVFLFFLLIGNSTESSIHVADQVQDYLTRFGYLSETDVKTSDVRTEDRLRSAVINLQIFGGIPATGQIDEATRKLMLTKRCGLPDRLNSKLSKTRHKRFTIQGQKWPYRALTWSLRTKQPNNLNISGIRLELSKALNLWAKNSKLTFREINSDRADILIRFDQCYHGDGYPFDGRGQILAHTFFPGRNLGGDAHFDDEEIWLLQDDDNGNGEGTSLFAVAAHEFGHSLGLAHSSVKEALMFPWYKTLNRNYELPEDDRRGIQRIYGVPEGKFWDNIPNTLPSTKIVSSTYKPWRIRPIRSNRYSHNGRLLRNLFSQKDYKSNELS